MLPAAAGTQAAIATIWGQRKRGCASGYGHHLSVDGGTGGARRRPARRGGPAGPLAPAPFWWAVWRRIPARVPIAS
jgi:hypothetical protein